MVALGRNELKFTLQLTEWQASLGGGSRMGCWWLTLERPWAGHSLFATPCCLAFVRSSYVAIPADNLTLGDLFLDNLERVAFSYKL